MRDDDLLKMSDVLKEVPLSKTTIYAWIKMGVFPAPSKLPGTRSVFWSRAQIRLWKEQHWGLDKASA